jgi:hypothetical protein
MPVRSRGGILFPEENAEDENEAMDATSSYGNGSTLS